MTNFDISLHMCRTRRSPRPSLRSSCGLSHDISKYGRSEHAMGHDISETSISNHERGILAPHCAARWSVEGLFGENWRRIVDTIGGMAVFSQLHELVNS
jgi:hypothetical protein